jgi:hypothetical protein
MAKTAIKQVKRPKHVPLRSCVSCRETKPKRELLRVVRTPDGHVLVDATGKKIWTRCLSLRPAFLLGKCHQEKAPRAGI